MDLRKIWLTAVPTFFSLYLLWWIFSPIYYFFTHLCVLSVLAVVAWTVAHCIYDHFNTETVSPNNKSVLITGCDSGFGHQLAQRLDKFGK